MMNNSFFLPNSKPENGYETPRYPEDESIFFGGMQNVDGERRRSPLATQEGSSTGSEKCDNRGKANDGLAARDGRDTRKVGFRGRVSCYTWTCFTLTMATGGIANVLHTIPYRSDWLRIIGTVIFLLNVLLFLLNCTLISLRFKWNPGSLAASFASQSESLFIPACVVSSGIILTNVCQYGIPRTGIWLQKTMEICFWIYVAFSFLVSAGIYLIIWSTQTFPIHTMTPIWIFPAYPLLITAPFASNLLDSIPSTTPQNYINTTAIAFGAVSTQGTGFCVSLMIYSAFIYRLMSQKLPRETARPGMFVSIGPSAFTVSGIMGLGNAAETRIFPHGYQGYENAASFVKLFADLIGFWLWGLCFWFFLVSVGAHWNIMHPFDHKHQLKFDMTWYSFVFPNTALVTATFAVARSVNVNGIKIFGTILAALLIVLWLFVFGMMIQAFLRRKFLWPELRDGKPILPKRWSLRLPQDPRGESRATA